MKSWSIDRLRDLAGPRRVPISIECDGQHFHGPHEVMQHEVMSFSSFLDVAETAAGERYYLSQIDIPKYLPELEREIRVPGYLLGSTVLAQNLWIGPGGSTTPLHYDYHQNLLAQLVGDKEILLFPPRALRKLRPFRFWLPGHHVSRHNVSTADRAGLAAPPDLEAMRTRLVEGETLYIPPYWWHAMRGVGWNVSVNFWWPALRTQKLRHLRYPMRRLGYQLFGRRSRSMIRPSKKHNGAEAQ